MRIYQSKQEVELVVKAFRNQRNDEDVDEEGEIIGLRLYFLIKSM